MKNLFFISVFFASLSASAQVQNIGVPGEPTTTQKLRVLDGAGIGNRLTLFDASGNALPFANGVNGQALRMTINGFAWGDTTPVYNFPAGGTTGQIWYKTSNADRVGTWQTPNYITPGILSDSLGIYLRTDLFTYGNLPGTPIPITNNTQLTNGREFITAAGAVINLTTTGTSGAATWNPNTRTFNVPQYAGQTYSNGYGLFLSSNQFRVDSFNVATRARLNKKADSIIALFPSIAGLATQSSLNDTAANIRNALANINLSGYVTTTRFFDSLAAHRALMGTFYNSITSLSDTSLRWNRLNSTGDTVEFNIYLLPAGSSGSAGVTSFNSRTGAVVPAANDYTFAQIGAKPTTIAGYGITDAFTQTLADARYLQSYIETDPLRIVSAAVTGTTSKTMTFTRANAATFTATWTDETGGGASGVSSFNTRTGAVTAQSGDYSSFYYPLTGNPSNFLTGITGTQVTTALGFTPYNATNPAGYITASALTPYELLSNKSTATALGTSNTLYPSQNAVKTYVDNAVAGVSGGGFTNTAQKVQLTTDITMGSVEQTVLSLSLTAGTYLITGQVEFLMDGTGYVEPGVSLTLGTTRVAFTRDHTTSPANYRLSLPISTTVTITETTILYMQAGGEATNFVDAIAGEGTQLNAIKLSN